MCQEKPSSNFLGKQRLSRIWLGLVPTGYFHGQFSKTQIALFARRGMEAKFHCFSARKSVHSLAVTQDGKKLPWRFENFVAIYVPMARTRQARSRKSRQYVERCFFAKRERSRGFFVGRLLIYDVEGKKPSSCSRLVRLVLEWRIFKWTPMALN